MADVATKKITDLAENTAVTDSDLFMVGASGTASLRKIKWLNIMASILSKVRSGIIVNNRTTTASGYALDARQGKAIDEEIEGIKTEIQNSIMGTSTTLGAEVRVTKTADVIILSISGTLTANIVAGSTYNFYFSEDCGHAAGSFVTSNGLTGYAILNGTTLSVTFANSITAGAWLIASAVLQPGL